MMKRPMDQLRGSLKALIERFDDESKRHKSIHRHCATGTIVLSTATTIVAASGLVLDKSHSGGIQFAVVCLTALTAAVTAWAEMRRARELWQHEREVYYALLDIEREIEYESAHSDLGKEQLDRYFHRITAVLGDSTKRWTQILAEQKAAEKAGDADD